MKIKKSYAVIAAILVIGGCLLLVPESASAFRGGPVCDHGGDQGHADYFRDRQWQCCR